VAKKEKLTLENFGCSGATTTSIFAQTGCPAEIQLRPPPAV